MALLLGAAPFWGGCAASSKAADGGAGMAAAPRPESAAADPAAHQARAQRIVSLDYCADQYLLRLADRNRILAVSPEATDAYSYMREAARGLPAVRARAEDVLVLRPDLVLRAYGGGPGAAALFERAGVPVLEVGYPDDIAAIRATTLRVAQALGEPRRGAALVAALDGRVDALEGRSAADATALYLTPGGVAAGTDTLVDELLTLAGLRNFQREPGWADLPLERLVREQPSLLAAAFFETRYGATQVWSAARHPVARRLMTPSRTVPLRGAWTACPGWFVLDAAEALADAAGSLP